ncbi:hypothetical protein GPECTOR_1g606 [Gonium pectorale]|uniref:Protein kinase domain-containing protein n=1 Tax=Gonium pectorale TaxID=33097 RepID=A0A150H3Q8_GONPE|nr:hypothetical protein GPECTOR_1g606 [Gonium pectorale]|eukprot:KXZ56673.1 hypothetical protein GPECTOR_1g606 [Gonium pectorale]
MPNNSATVSYNCPAPTAQLGGKYNFQKKIELYKGSVSTVYKCLLTGGAPVVVKMYHKGKMAEKHLHKLEREIAIMRALGRTGSHGHIVQLLDTFEDTQAVYLIMECCDSGDLFKRMMLHGGKLPEAWVCAQVVAPLLRVLDLMHGMSVIHRDIKPENIFITHDGNVKLGDFGLAIDSTNELPFSRSGTLDYMAPEVLLNPATHMQEATTVTAAQLQAKNIKPYSCGVDVWAIGCLAYELVCGRPPFEVEDEKQTASLIIYSNIIRFDPSASSAWANFVTQALTKDPKQRPSAATLLNHAWVRNHLQHAEPVAVKPLLDAFKSASVTGCASAVTSVNKSLASGMGDQGGPGGSKPQGPINPSQREPPASPPRNGWVLSGSPAPAPAASSLNELTRNWGAVVTVSVSKLFNGGRRSRSGSGSAFASPQRPPAGAPGAAGGGKGQALDALGLPPPTPVAAGMAPAEYCSPKPVGVLERVKYHLRGGSSVALQQAPTPTAPGAVGGQQPQ